MKAILGLLALAAAYAYRVLYAVTDPILRRLR